MSITKLSNIKSQIEFYFSDANYTKDHFLNTTCAQNNGFIPISTLLKFKKLAELSATENEVIEAIKDSKIVECEDKNLRKVITEEYKLYLAQNSADERIVAVLGWPKNYSLQDIKTVLEKFCTPMLVRMRKDKKKLFNGEILVETASKEEAENLIGKNIEVDDLIGKNIEDKKVKLGKTVLETMSKKDFENKLKIEVKKEEKKSHFGKIFKYKTAETLSILEIKNIVKNCAYVDNKNCVARFNNVQDFDEKEFKNENGTSVVLTLMNKDETEKYVKKFIVKKELAKKKKK